MNQRQFKSEQRYTAYHEAGHAVICHRVCQRPFDYITINPMSVIENNSGAVVFKVAAKILDVQDLVKECIHLYAGPIAEARIRKMSVYHISVTSGREDYNTARDLISRALGPRQVPEDGMLEGLAFNEVARYWDEIVTVAEALIEKGWFEYDEFLELVHG